MKKLGVLIALLPAAACMAGAGRPAPAESRPDTLELVVAATTDTHGRLRGWDYYASAPDSSRGLSRAATIVDSLRQVHPGRVVLVDAGDLLQGNPLTFYAARVDSQMPHPVIAAMNAMRYDAAAIGNHEFNYGLGTLARAIGEARFPFLAANARKPDGARAYPAYTVVERAGYRVAIVGATNPGAMIWDRANLAGRLVVRDIVGEVRRAVEEVRRSERPDVVIAVLHSGLDGPPSFDTVTTGVPPENVAARVAREVPGLDLVVYGHSHQEEAGRTIGSTLLIQPRNHATSIAVATLRVARGRGVLERRGTVVQAAGRAEHPTVVAAVERAHQATLRYVSTPIGTTSVAWRLDSARVMDTPIIDFINEVQRRRTNADLSAASAFVESGGLDSGAITIADIAQLYPYENTLKAVRITGAQLRAFLEYSARYYRSVGSTPIVDPAVRGYNYDMISGADYVLDLSQPVGSRVTSLSVRGRPVQPSDSFTLAVNNYRQGGGGGYAMLHGAPVVYDEQEDVRALLIDEVRRRGTLRPEDYFTRNWRLEPPAALAQAAAELRVARRASAPRQDRHLSSGRWLRILSTNDFHGALEARRDSLGVERGGAAYLIAELEAARRACAAPRCRSLWLDGGDMFQGTAASNLAFGRPVLEIFNRHDLAAAALGNHEFDWGIDTLRARMREARYRILGANVRDSAGRDIGWIPDDTLVQLGDLRIGIVGLALPSTPLATKAAIVKDLRFVDPVPVIDAHARALRARGAQYVVVVAHIGAFCGSTSDSCRGEIVDIAGRVTEKVDAIVSGHTHSAVRAVVRGTPVIQARSRSLALGILDVPLSDSAAPVLQVREVRADQIAPDTAVAAIVRTAVERVQERMSVPVVEIGEHLELGVRSALGKLVADAQRHVGGGDVAIMNNGGLRAPLRRGLATYGSLYEVHPFGNALVRLTVTGRELRAELERQVADGSFTWHLSGLRVVIDTTRPPGQRLTSLTRADGTPLSATTRYRVVLSDFLADGGDGLQLTRHAIRREDLEILDVDALMTYLKTLPAPVRGPGDERVTVRR